MAVFTQSFMDRVEPFIRDQLERTRTGSESLHARVLEDWDIYNMEPPGFNSFPNCSNVRSDAVRNAVKVKSDLFDDSVLQSKHGYDIKLHRFLSSTRDQETSRPLQAIRGSLEKAWQYVFDHECRIRESLRSDTKVLCVQGYVVLKIKREIRYDVRAEPGTGKKTRVQVQMKKVADRPQLKTVHYSKFYCDSEYEDLQDAAMVAEEVVHPAARLKYWAENVPGWSKESVTSAVDSAQRIPQTDSVSTDQGDEIQDRPDENPLLVLYEFYTEVPPEFTGYEYPVKFYGVYDTNIDKILYLNLLSDLDPDNRYPYEVPALYEPTDTDGPRWWGYGIPRWHKVLAEMIDRAINRMTDDAILHGRPSLIRSSRDMTLVRQGITLAPWSDIVADFPDQLHFLEIPATAHALHVEQYQLWQQRFERDTSVYPANLGDMSALKSHQTSESVSTVMQQSMSAQVTDGFRIAEQYQRVLRRLAGIRVQIFRERLAEANGNVDKVDDPLLDVLTQEELIDFVTFSGERYIRDELLWEFDVSKLRKRLQVPNLLTALQILQGLPAAQIFPERINDLVVDLLSALDIDGAEQLRITPAEMIDRQSTIQAMTLLKASVRDRESFLKGIDPEVIQKFLAMAQEVSQGTTQMR